MNRDFLLLLIPLFFYCASTQAKEPRPKFLTETYGVLSAADSEAIGSWQCFKQAEVIPKYDNMGYEKDWDSVIGEVSIEIVENKEVILTYSMPRPYPKKLCKKWIREWKALMNNESYVCLGGFAPTEDKQLKTSKGTFVTDWAFEYLKTKKGCWGRTSKC